MTSVQQFGNRIHHVVDAGSEAICFVVIDEPAAVGSGVDDCRERGHVQPARTLTGHLHQQRFAQAIIFINLLHDDLDQVGRFLPKQILPNIVERDLGFGRALGTTSGLGVAAAVRHDEHTAGQMCQAGRDQMLAESAHVAHRAGAFPRCLAVLDPQPDFVVARPVNLGNDRAVIGQQRIDKPASEVVLAPLVGPTVGRPSQRRRRDVDLLLSHVRPKHSFCDA